MIFKKRDCVAVDGSRIGRVDCHFYEGGRRCYVVQFGADGPFEQVQDDRLRAASKNEEDWLEGLRLHP